MRTIPLAVLILTLNLGGSVTQAQTTREGNGGSVIQPPLLDKAGRAWVCNDWHARVRPSLGFDRVHRRVLWLIRCATERWSVPGGYEMARCIATRESGPYTWPWAYNPSGSAGVFQIVSGTYSSWWRAFAVRVQMHRLIDSVFSARTNVLLSVWAMNAYGLGAWSGGCG